MNTKVVFCTSLTHKDKQRYQNWVDYYTKFFDGCSVDLFMINDGPLIEQLDWKGVKAYEFDENLGRESVWIFPGWKRSFYYALVWLSGYKSIAHIESDCWISEKGKKDFLYYFNQTGYFTGYVPKYSFPEASLQIINNQGVKQYFLDKYSCIENWYENIDFEKDLERLNPTYILDGDRLEGNFSLFSKRFSFVSGTTFEDFKKLYD